MNVDCGLIFGMWIRCTYSIGLGPLAATVASREDADDQRRGQQDRHDRENLTAGRIVAIVAVNRGARCNQRRDAV